MTPSTFHALLKREWEVVASGDRYLIVYAPRCMATVDLHERCFRAGGNVRHGRSANGLTYKGRRWREALAADVVAWIEEWS